MNKNLLPIVLSLMAILSPLRADDITLSDGTVLKNAKILERDPSNKIVTIAFSGGTALVHLEMLPSALAIVAQASTTTNATTTSISTPEPPTPTPPSNAADADWTVDGKDYQNVKVIQVEADRVHITYDGGIGTVMIADLPPDLRKRLNYDPVNAMAASKERSKQQADADAGIAAEIAAKQKAIAQAAAADKAKLDAAKWQAAQQAAAAAAAKPKVIIIHEDSSDDGSMRSIGGG
jgi:hypothetical protein